MTDPRAAGAGEEAPAAPKRAALRVPLPVRVIIVLAFLATLALASARIQARVRDLEDFRVDRSQVLLAGVPPWMGGAERLELATDLGVDDIRPLHDADLLEDTARLIASDPRVERVVEVRRVLPNRVEVVVDLRRPVALLDTPEGVVPVDAHGVRLPPGNEEGLPVLRAPFDDIPRPGRPFGEAVCGATSLLASLPGDLLRELGLHEMVVDDPPEGVAVRLLRRASPGRQAVVVEWGRAPHATGVALDPPAEEKIERLRLAAARFPGLEGLRTVRLHFDDLIVVPR